MTDQLVINPYAPPKANLDASSDVTTVQAFPRFSTWWVLLLSFATLGAYLVYWLYTRTKILNRLTPANPIPMGFAAAAVIMLLVSAAASVLDGMYPHAIGLRQMSSAISMISGIVNLVWAFMFRHRLNEHFVPREDDRYWLNGVLTFFFTVFYVQCKLNELIDRERAAAPVDPLAAGAAA